MPTRTGLQEPRSYLDDGEWPTGRLVEDTPLVIVYAQLISRRVAEALPNRQQRRVANETGMARSTLNDLLSGRRMPDLVSIVKLEKYLGTRLWPTAEEIAAAHHTAG